MIHVSQRITITTTITASIIHALGVLFLGVFLVQLRKKTMWNVNKLIVLNAIG